jgi:hypothetical protein
VQANYCGFEACCRYGGRGDSHILCEILLQKKQKILLAKFSAARQNDTVRYLEMVNGADECCMSRKSGGAN